MDKNDFGYVDDATFTTGLCQRISKESFDTILSARKEALTDMNKVIVTVPTEIKFLGELVWLRLEFDGMTAKQGSEGK